MNTFQIMQEVWRGAYGRTRVMTAGFLTILFSLTIAVWFQCNAASVNDKFTIAMLFVVVSVIVSGVFIYPLIARTDTAQALPVDLRDYFNPWASTLIWFAVVTGGLYLFPVQRHPWMAGAIVIGVSIIVLAFVWGKTPTWARTAIYYGSIVVVIGAVSYFTLALTLKPLFGIDLMSTPGDREIVATQERIEEANKAATAVALLIPENHRTAEQKALIAKYAGDVSVLGKTKKLFHTDEAQASSITTAQKTAQTEPTVEAKTVVAPVTPAPVVQAAPPAEKKMETSELTMPIMKLGSWHLSCKIAGQAMGEDMVVQKADTTSMRIVGKVTGTTFSGGVIKNRYEGTLSDPIEGEGSVWVQPLTDHEAVGSWKLDGKDISFRMKFTG